MGIGVYTMEEREVSKWKGQDEKSLTSNYGILLCMHMAEYPY